MLWHYTICTAIFLASIIGFLAIFCPALKREKFSPSAVTALHFLGYIRTGWFLLPYQTSPNLSGLTFAKTYSSLTLHVFLRMLALFWSFMEPEWQGLQLDSNSNSGYQERSHFQCFSLAIKGFYLEVTHVSSTHILIGQNKSCDQRVQKSAILLMCLQGKELKYLWSPNDPPALPVSSSTDSPTNYRSVSSLIF